MAKFQPLSDLHRFRNDWCVHVKVLRGWTVEDERYGTRMEFILADEYGVKISAIIPNHVLERRNENELIQDQCYVIEMFRVVEPKGVLRNTDHKYEIYLNSETKIREVSSFTDSKFFEFKEFKEVINRDFYPEFTIVDLIGGVTSVTEIRSYVDAFSDDQWAVKNRYIKFKLKNCEGEFLNCVANGEYANEIFRKFKGFDQPVTLCVLRFWRVNVFGGETNVISQDGCSEILVEPIDDEYVTDFKYMTQYSGSYNKKEDDHLNEWRYVSA